MKKLLHSVANLTIATGHTETQTTLLLKRGQCLTVALYEENNPSSNVNVKLSNIQGEELHPSVTYKNYKPTNGNYNESMKSFIVHGGQEIDITATSKTALTSNFSFQMIFNIESETDL